MSFVFDMDGVMSTASSLFNSLWPIFVIPIGLALAFGLINLVYKMIIDRLPH